jgi:TM2 domain-containing membrane protein YozV
MNEQQFSQPRPDRKNPVLAAILSLIIVGLGQAYAGEWWRALGFFVVGVILGITILFAIGFVLVPIWWIVAAYDAYRQTIKRNQRYGYEK